MSVWKTDKDFIKAFAEEEKLREENISPFEELKIRINRAAFMTWYDEENDARMCQECDFGKQRTPYYPKFQHKDICSANKHRSLINSIGDMIA
jgi:hypothetical protein